MDETHRQVTVAVAGAGPAGLMAAIAAAQRGAAVTVFEQLDRAGAKLLATGGGRCNLTNTLPGEEFMARFGRQGRFMAPALAAMDSAALREFFARLDVPTACADGLHVYPTSNSAATVRAALLRRCGELNVQVRLKAAIASLWIRQGVLAGVQAGGQVFPTARVVLACGGSGYPELGGTGGGYALARQAGHEIIEPTPALVPLVTQERWPGRCAGIGLPQARVWIDLPGQSRQGCRGDVLFTHRGVSGPAVLDLSGQVAALLGRGPVPLRIDLSSLLIGAAEGAPAGPRLEAMLAGWQQSSGKKMVRTLLGGAMPSALAAALCQQAGIRGDTRCAHLPATARRSLVEMLSGARLTVTATEGFPQAMVTRGGVALRQVNPRTMESRLLKGLLLAGEVLDLDGPCGGFNLQWAFSSGNLAGLSAAEP